MFIYYHSNFNFFDYIIIDNIFKTNVDIRFIDKLYEYIDTESPNTAQKNILLSIINYLSKNKGNTIYRDKFNKFLKK